MARFFYAIPVGCAAAGLCLSCGGQTSQPRDPIAFFQPALHLRQESPPPPPAKAEVQATGAKPPGPGPALAGAPLIASVGQPGLHGSYVRSDEFYLIRNAPQFDRDIDRFVDNVYRPEVFHLGKIPMTFTVWTAIKRKNPLCVLLNPIVFQASW